MQENETNLLLQKIMQKMEDEVLEKVLKRIEEKYDLNEKTGQPLFSERKISLPNTLEDTKETEDKVTKLLFKMGFTANVKGFKYIRTAILITLKDENILESVTKALYIDVAKEYETTASRVERAIRHAIETTWRRGNLQLIDKIFQYSVDPNKGKPTNSEFIAMMVEMLKME